MMSVILYLLNIKRNTDRKFICVICIFMVFASLLLFAESSSETDSANKRLAQQAMSNPDYRVLPGDIYQLGYTVGQSAVSYQIVVDSSGVIRVSNLGSVNVNGKTFLVVKKQVESLVSQNYPLSVVQFVLASPSSFTVTIKGEVSKTTEVKAWGLMRASQAINGLLTEFSSNRYLSITGSSGKTIEYDLFKALRDGDLRQDPYLSPGDVITIPRVKRRILLSGAIERPGTYELAEQESISDLISIYGNGYIEGADKTQVKVTRTKEDSNGKLLFDSFFLDVNDAGHEARLQHLDKVYVDNRNMLRSVIYLDIPVDAETRIAILTNSQKTSEQKNNHLNSTVSHSTAQTAANPINKNSDLKVVTTTIIIPFTQGDDVVSIIRERFSLFTKPWVDTTGAYIFRRGKQIPINLNPLLFDSSYSELMLLEAGDRLIIPEMKHTVTVTGAVANPGTYLYTPGRTFEYYIALAGGFDYQRNTGQAVEITDVYGKRLRKDSVIGPNTTIAAKSNAFMYNFNIYAPLITVTATVLTIITTILALTKR